MSLRNEKIGPWERNVEMERSSKQKGSLRFGPWVAALVTGGLLVTSGCELIVRVSEDDLQCGPKPVEDADGPACGEYGPDAGATQATYICRSDLGYNCQTCGDGCGECASTDGDDLCDGCVVDKYLSDERNCLGNAEETPVNAPCDCSCGNGVCDWYESCKTCPEDCGQCDQPPASHECTSWADKQWYPDLCGGCGNGRCPQTPSDPDYALNGWKNCFNCPQDCGYCILDALPGSQ